MTPSICTDLTAAQIDLLLVAAHGGGWVSRETLRDGYQARRDMKSNPNKAMIALTERGYLYERTADMGNAKNHKITDKGIDALLALRGDISDALEAVDDD